MVSDISAGDGENDNFFCSVFLKTLHALLGSITWLEGKQTTRKKNGIFTAFLISHGTVSLIKKAAGGLFTNKAQMEKKNGIPTSKTISSHCLENHSLCFDANFVRGAQKNSSYKIVNQNLEI